MTPDEFRARATGLLEELEATDVGQVAVAALEWGREQLAAERQASGVDVDTLRTR